MKAPAHFSRIPCRSMTVSLFPRQASHKNCRFKK
jgi:hypothetical protein